MAQIASGQGRHWLIALLRYVSTLFLNVFTLQAFTQSVDNLFHSFIVLCENNIPLTDIPLLTDIIVN